MDQRNSSSSADPITLWSVAKTYGDRLDAGLCTRCGKEPAKEDSSLGEACHAKVKAYQAKSARKRRAAAKRKKLCTRCAVRRRSPMSDWGCARCMSEVGGLKKRLRARNPSLVNRYVDQSAKTRDHTEGDGWTRTRFHGQAKRGAPSTAALDSMDLRDAIKSLADAAHGYEYAQSAEVQQKPAIQREAHVDDWVAIVHRVRKVLSDIEGRHPDAMRRMSPDENRARGVEIARKRKRTRG